MTPRTRSTLTLLAVAAIGAAGLILTPPSPSVDGPAATVQTP